MSNQERAAEIAHEAMLEAPRKRGMEKDVPNYITQALVDAGLLMPDLPAPDGAEEGKPYWYSSTYGIAVGQLVPGGRQNVMFWDSEPGGVAYMGIEGARELAYALLAAANLAEKSADDRP